jgi:hypothetical protein
MPASGQSIPEPWGRFLRALDARLAEDVALHCLGGLAITMQYGQSRATSDIDVLAAVPVNVLAQLEKLAGLSSDLHRRFGVYLQPVRIVAYPEDYTSRLVRMWPAERFDHLELFALEAYDLALTKLERNSDVDRQDVQALAKAGFINEVELRRRYEREYRPNLAAGEKALDLTLQLWVDMCWPKAG